MNKQHENIRLELTSLLFLEDYDDVLKLGEKLSIETRDLITDGGFWIWDIKNNIEYYSPLFRKSIGFEGEQDFPSVPESWMRQIYDEDKEIAINNYTKTLESGGSHPYHQVVRYRTKNGQTIEVLCSGTLMREPNGNPKYLFGTHKIDF